MYPVVDIVEVGAGGGSIAWLDEVGALKVGPRSAGGHPGPVCYGQGGTEPTVTDANVVLGRLSPTRFLGGEMPLDIDGARNALKTKIADPLGLGIDEAALGIIKIAVAEMSLAVRSVSVGRGYDPRDFAMVAFGGAGPLHAAEIARELHIPTLVIPRVPGHFSAFGMLLADLRHDYVRTYYKPLVDSDFDAIHDMFEAMIAEGRELLASEGAQDRDMGFQRFLDMRYVGQEFPIQTPLSDERSCSAAIRKFCAKPSTASMTAASVTRRSTSRSRSSTCASPPPAGASARNFPSSSREGPTPSSASGRSCSTIRRDP